MSAVPPKADLLPIAVVARRHATIWHDGQISAFPKPQIRCLIPAIPFRQEGRSRVVTNVGWDVVDARALACTAVTGRVEPREGLQARKTNDA